MPRHADRSRILDPKECLSQISTTSPQFAFSVLQDKPPENNPEWKAILSVQQLSYDPVTFMRCIGNLCATAAACEAEPRQAAEVLQQALQQQAQLLRALRLPGCFQDKPADISPRCSKGAPCRMGTAGVAPDLGAEPGEAGGVLEQGALRQAQLLQGRRALQQLREIGVPQPVRAAQPQAAQAGQRPPRGHGCGCNVPKAAPAGAQLQAFQPAGVQPLRHCHAEPTCGLTTSMQAEDWRPQSNLAVWSCSVPHLGDAHCASASERQGGSRAEHSGSTTSSGSSSVNSRSTVGVINLAEHTAVASCTCMWCMCLSVYYNTDCKLFDPL